MHGILKAHISKTELSDNCITLKVKKQEKMNALHYRMYSNYASVGIKKNNNIIKGSATI